MIMKKMKKTLLALSISQCCLFPLVANVYAQNILQTYEMAVSSDPSSIASQIKVLISQSQQQQAEANLYPQASITGNASRNDLKIVNSSSSAQQYNGKSLRLSINQALLNLSSYRENQRWQLLTNKSENDYLQAQRDLMTRVVEKYLGVLSSEDNFALVQQRKKAINENLNQLNALYKKQLIKVTSVYEAQARLDQVLSEEIQADANRAVAFEQLYSIIGERVKNLSPLKDDLNFPEIEGSIKDWLDLALKNNANLIAAKTSIAVAKKELDVKNAAYFPTISMGLNYSHQNTGYDNAPAPTTNTATIGLNFSQPLYQGGKISAGKSESVHRLALAEQGVIEMQRKVEQQLRENYLGIKTQRLNIKATKQLIESEKKRKESIKAAFNYGTATINDVFIADTDYYSAQVKHQQAKYNYIQHYLQLKNIAGVLTEKDIIDINAWVK